MRNEVYLIIIFIMVLLNVYLVFKLNRLSKVDGQVVITQNEDGKKIFSLELNRSPDQIENMDKIIFKVSNSESSDYEDL